MNILNESNPTFSRMLVYQYYDGLVSGVIEYHQAYRFDMLDRNAKDTVRIFGLTLLPAGSFDALVKICAETDSPRWPIWYPKWNYATDKERNDAYSRFESTINQAAVNLSWILAWDMLANKIICIKQVDVNKLDSWSPWDWTMYKASMDWFKYIDLNGTL